MAHFLIPPSAVVIGYDINHDIAPNAVWRMQVPLGSTRAVALWGGANLWIRSNNPDVVPNDGFKTESNGDVQILTLAGLSLGTSMLEAGQGEAVWATVQVQVVHPSQVSNDLPETRISRPSVMRETAWRYLLEFTKKHEYPVFHMYNNRREASAAQDVTCGIGFLLENRTTATREDFKLMFYDPATGEIPSNDQLMADWDAAANLTRTNTNISQYANVCKLRMKQDRVFDKMALILRDQKLPALLKFSGFSNFESFPAAAQVFSLSFAYGLMPRLFPKMCAAIEKEDWRGAAMECKVTNMAELKNIGHRNLLLFAQKVVDEGLDYNIVPSTIL